MIMKILGDEVGIAEERQQVQLSPSLRSRWVSRWSKRLPPPMTVTSEATPRVKSNTGTLNDWVCGLPRSPSDGAASLTI